jgi:hypothetical protein
MTSTSRGLVAVFVAFALLGLAWLIATPQWYGPDEAAQYLRAVTLSEGHLVGPRVPIDPAGTAALSAGGWQATQERWLLHDRRGVVVGAKIARLASCASTELPSWVRANRPAMSTAVVGAAALATGNLSSVGMGTVRTPPAAE